MPRMVPRFARTLTTGLAGLVVLLASWLVWAADDSAAPRTQGKVPQPVIETAAAGQCVGPPDFMRRNHMNLLKHQRDETLRGGNRQGRYSLKECIACHASQTTHSVTAASTNFCQSCHAYAAVKIDCFECHANSPEAKQ